jgi:hypothetical protein
MEALEEQQIATAILISFSQQSCHQIGQKQNDSTSEGSCMRLHTKFINACYTVSSVLYTRVGRFFALRGETTDTR